MCRLSLKDWRQKQIVDLVTPSGLKVKVRVPDYLQLIQDWRELGITNPFNEKTKLGQEIAKPKNVAALLMKYVLEPKITRKSTDKTLGIQELMTNRQTDAQLIWVEIVKPFVTQTDAMMEFFRKHESWLKAGLSRAANRMAPKHADAVK